MQYLGAGIELALADIGTTASADGVLMRDDSDGVVKGASPAQMRAHAQVPGPVVTYSGDLQADVTAAAATRLPLFIPPGTDIVLSSPVSIPAGSALNIYTVGTRRRRADATPAAVTISASTSMTHLIDYYADDDPLDNDYGVTVEGINFDLGNVSVAALDTQNVSHGRMIDCHAQDFGNTSVKHLVNITVGDTASGADSAFWSIEGCVAHAVGLVKADGANYLAIDAASHCLEYTAGPAIHVTGDPATGYGSCLLVNGTILEGCPIGVKATNVRGPQIIWPRSERISDACVELEGCWDSVVLLSSLAGTYGVHLRETACFNTYAVTSYTRDIVSTAGPAMGSGRYGYDPHAAAPGTVRFLERWVNGYDERGAGATLPDATNVFAFTGLTLEYWDGDSWETFGDENNLLSSGYNKQPVTTAQDHFRIRSGRLYLKTAGTLYLAWENYWEAPGSAGTIEVIGYGSDGSTVVWSQVIDLAHPDPNWGDIKFSDLTGVLVGIRGDIEYLEIEVTATATGTWNLDRCALFVSPHGVYIGGRNMQGRGDPEGSIYGIKGDIWHDVQNGAIYTKTTDTSFSGSTTGWVKLAAESQTWSWRDVSDPTDAAKFILGGDAGWLIRLGTGLDVTCNLASDAIPKGAQFGVLAEAAGSQFLVSGSGVTVNGGTDAIDLVPNQIAVVSKIAANTWNLSGGA